MTALVRKWTAEHRRRDRLQTKRRRTPAEQAELARLDARLIGRWKRLPAYIQRLRARLADAERYADEIGLGPV